MARSAEHTRQRDQLALRQPADVAGTRAHAAAHTFSSFFCSVFVRNSSSTSTCSDGTAAAAAVVLVCVMITGEARCCVCGGAASAQMLLLLQCKPLTSVASICFSFFNCSSRFISLFVMNSSSASTCDCCARHRYRQLSMMWRARKQPPKGTSRHSPPPDSAPVYDGAHLHMLRTPCAPSPTAHTRQQQPQGSGHLPGPRSATAMPGRLTASCSFDRFASSSSRLISSCWEAMLMMVNVLCLAQRLLGQAGAHQHG